MRKWVKFSDEHIEKIAAEVEAASGSLPARRVTEAMEGINRAENLTRFNIRKLRDSLESVEDGLSTGQYADENRIVAHVTGIARALARREQSLTFLRGALGHARTDELLRETLTLPDGPEKERAA